VKDVTDLQGRYGTRRILSKDPGIEDKAIATRVRILQLSPSDQGHLENIDGEFSPIIILGYKYHKASTSNPSSIWKDR
jgi:hypothetical protein